MAFQPTISGPPISPVEGGAIYLVDGTLGNNKLIHHRHAKDGSPFYLLFAAEKGQSASEVAHHIQDHYLLNIRPFVPLGEKNTDGTQPAYRLKVHANASKRYQDGGNLLDFRPNLTHLSYRFGDKADYYLIACQFDPNDYNELFSAEKRIGRREDGQETGAFKNTLKLELTFQSAHVFASHAPDSPTHDILMKGLIALYTRTKPNGEPDDFQFFRLSDSHLGREHDAYAERMLRRFSTRPSERVYYFKFTNPNEVTDAEIDELNRKYEEGLCDLIIFQGDNINQNNPKFGDPTHSLMESNQIAFAKRLARLKAPVVAIRGNHEELENLPPAAVMAGNYTLPGNYLMALQSDRYWMDANETDLAGYARFIWDGQQALLNDANALQSFYDVISPFQDVRILLEGEETEHGRIEPFKIVLFDSGPSDLAHFRHDDVEIYAENLQGFWPFTIPFQHPGTIREFITNQSPDVLGPNNDQLAWLTQEQPNLILSHSYPLGNVRQRPFQMFPTETPIPPLEPAGDYVFNTFGAMVHNGRPLLLSCLANPKCFGISGGHQHATGNGYVAGLGINNELQIFHAHFIEALQRLSLDDDKGIACLWQPNNACVKTTAPAVAQLHEAAVDGMRNHRVIWQIGSAGTGPNPVMAFNSINPQGFIAQERYYYVHKILKAHPGNLYRLEHVVREEEPNNGNEDVAKEWQAMVQSGVRPKLDIEYEREKIRERNTFDTSFLLNSDSLKTYPHLYQPIERPLRSATTANHHLQLTLWANPPLGVDDNGAYWNLQHVGLGVRVLASQDWLGLILRNYLLAGIDIGWFRDRSNTQHFYAGIVSADQPLDWKIFTSAGLVLRGMNLSLGVGGAIPPDGGSPELEFHNDLQILNAAYNVNPWEVSVGFARRKVFSGEGEWVGTVTLDRTF